MSRLPRLLLGSAIAPAAHAYVHHNIAWPSGEVQVHLQLDAQAPAVTFPLYDGSASWNAAARPAITEWNKHLGRTKLVAVADSSAEIADENGINNVFWSDDIYGEPFGERVLAVTVLRIAADSAAASRWGEADVVFNRNDDWNSYDGLPRGAINDVGRVLLHELGHLLGLDHPDEADPPQDVDAVMNSVTSHVYLPRTDDINGLRELYGSTLGPLSITRSPANLTVPVGGRIRLDWDLNGAIAPAPGATQRYAWFFEPVGGTPEYLFTIDDPILDFGAAQPSDAGTYQVVAENPDWTAVSEPVVVQVSPVSISAQTRLANLSTRGVAGLGDRSMIVGFVVTGTGEKSVLLRAIGPTLASGFDVPGALPDPRLSLYRQDGGAQTLVVSNADWADLPEAEREDVESTSARVGAFTLTDSREAVLLVSLPPGVYSAVVESETGQSGVTLVEAYDADPDGPRTTRLGNLSTRGHVGRGADVLIGGLVVQGPAARTYLIRAVGDTLEQFNVSGTLDDPTLTLYTEGQAFLRYSDDWDSPFQLQPALETSMATVGAFSLTDRQETVLQLTLAPGSYSLHLRGFEDSEGVALLEVYEMDAP